jgi:hypothetical protein
MPRYRLLARHVIADVIREAGEEVEITCGPSFQMEPLDAAAVTALERFAVARGAPPTRGVEAAGKRPPHA